MLHGNRDRLASMGLGAVLAWAVPMLLALLAGFVRKLMWGRDSE